tara:strand:- start:3226 stop:4647 length:1422 start_codon:yes stop_codon:yes gene_type:complete
MYSVTNVFPRGFAFAPHKHDGTTGTYTDWEIDDNWHHIVFEFPGGSSSNSPIQCDPTNTAMYYDGSGPHALDGGSFYGSSTNREIYWNHGTRVRLLAEDYPLLNANIANFRLYISWDRPTKTPNARELYMEGEPTTRLKVTGMAEMTDGVKFGFAGVLFRIGDLDPVTGVFQWFRAVRPTPSGQLIISGGPIASHLTVSSAPNIYFIVYPPTGSQVVAMSMFSDGKIGVGFTNVGSTPHRFLIDGSAGATGGFHTASDDRIKYNESDITDPLALINQLKPQRYEKITETSERLGTWMPTDEEWENVKDKHKYSLEFGFIAQDVRKIPELAFLVNGEETKIVETDISSDEYDQLDSIDQDKCVPFYTRFEPNNEEQDETRINSEVYANLNPEVQKTYTLKYTTPVETQFPISLDYTGLSVLTTAGLQKVDAQLQTTKTDLDREKLKTTSLQERILVMEQAYHALLERVSELENN